MFHGAGSRICPNVAGPLGITAKPSWASKRLGDEPSPGQWVRAPINCGLALWAGMAYGPWRTVTTTKKKCYYFSKKTKRKCYCIREILLFFFCHIHTSDHTRFFEDKLVQEARPQHVHSYSTDPAAVAVHRSILKRTGAYRRHT